METDVSIQGSGECVVTMAGGWEALPHCVCKSGEQNYGITKLEMLAVVWAVTHFRAYLYGSRVTIYTDHSAVKSVFLVGPPCNRKACPMVVLSFNSGIKEIEIVYQPGKENACADALSHCPHASAPAKGIAKAEARVLLCEVDDIEQLLQRKTHQ